MKRKIYHKTGILFLFSLRICAAWAEESLQVEAIRVAPGDTTVTLRRTIYDLNTRFAPTDTVLWLQKAEGLTIAAVETKSAHELEMMLNIKSGSVACGRYLLTICDSALQRKTDAVLNILSSAPPAVDSVRAIFFGRKMIDTLLVDPERPLKAHLCIYGRRFPQDAQIEFADPAIVVKSTYASNEIGPSAAMCADIEIASEATLGEGVLTLKSVFSPDAAKKIFIRSMRPPRLFTEINDLTADGKSKALVLEGSNFAFGVTTKFEGASVAVRSRRLSSEKLEIRFFPPILDETAHCRIIIQNPDEQADTSNTFFLYPPPLAAAHAEPIDQLQIFGGKPARLLVTASVDRNRRLQKGKTYELTIDGQRFPVQLVTSDSTCEVEVLLPASEESRLLRRHLFTLQESGRPPQWRGVFTSRLPPRIDSISSRLTLHPGDSLTIVIKGARLKEVLLGIADPEVSFQVLEQREDLLRVSAIASLRVRIGDYPLEAYSQGSVFKFDDYRLSIRPWQPFSDYVVFHLSSTGDLPPETCFRGIESMHTIKPDELVTVRIKPSHIDPNLGVQKLLISGILTDSTGAVRAEAFDSRRIAAAAGEEEITWRWRARERIRSGDRLEITLQNPGNQNRITEYFVVAPHWSEAFHGSTSFILCKIPFGGGDEKTQILNSIGLGVSWQPFLKKRFFELDASFIVGNAKSDKNDYAVQVGTGLSAIFWQHLQLGIGANLTGQSLSKGFIFIGTRFKLPVAL